MRDIKEKFETAKRDIMKFEKDRQQKLIAEVTQSTDVGSLIEQLLHTVDNMDDAFKDIVSLIEKFGSIKDKDNDAILLTIQLKIDTAIATINRIHYLALTKKEDIFKSKNAEIDEEEKRENTIEELMRIFSSVTKTLSTD